MQNIINLIKTALKNASDEKTRISGQRFFKEEIISYGVKMPLVEKIGKEIYKESNLQSKTEVFQLCEALFQSGILEETIIACHWSYYVHKQYEASDFLVFERWLTSYVNNWATCDTFCNHTLGEFIEMYPEYLPELKKMAKSDNRWVRRAAAVSLIVPARKGMFLPVVFEIADILLIDRDDLVQKGYGWMLKVAASKHEQAVFDYVIKNKAVMPRTALRYAIEKMPKEMRTVAMAK
ncbi:MAG: DNA alkylation repair protein [Prolixibacteraceae bacterium]|nr:DNA alkylation repair protein [Prolixibacteraceae bacterium]MBN2648175.1 DNA alkylation repair protein [Prolixibacteraceae bacterium]